MSRGYDVVDCGVAFMRQGDCGLTTLCVVSRIRDFARIGHLSKRLTPY